MRRQTRFYWTSSPNTQITYSRWNDPDDGSTFDSSITDQCLYAKKQNQHKWSTSNCGGNKYFICQLQKPVPGTGTSYSIFIP